MCLAAEYSLSFLRVAGLRSPHEWLCLRPHIPDSEISASVEKFIERVQQTGELAEWLAEEKKKRKILRKENFPQTGALRHIIIRAKIFLYLTEVGDLCSLKVTLKMEIGHVPPLKYYKTLII